MKLIKDWKLAKNPLSLKIDKAEISKTGRFIGLFVLVYLFLSVLFFSIGAEQATKGFLANSVAGFFNGEVSFEEQNPVVSLQGNTRIEIGELCTGLTELLIIVSAVLASIGISLKKRVLGAVAAAALVLVLNIFRIFATIFLILGSSDLMVVELAHNILFRIFLFISIAAIYIAWFYWAVKSEKAIAEK